LNRILRTGLVLASAAVLPLILVCNKTPRGDAPATPPAPSGTSNGCINARHEFIASTTDPDEDSVCLRFHWGDGDTSAWSRWVASGKEATMSHSWTSAGAYEVRAQAKDRPGLESGWSEPLTVAIALDAGEFLIDTNGTHSESSPAVAFDGTNFLVVWTDERNGDGLDIYGTRVSPAGAVLDPAGIAICAGPYNQDCPAVAFDGTNFLVVWGDGDICGARVTSTGAVLDPAGIAICAGPYTQDCPAVAFDGTNFLVVWTDWRNDSRDIYACRVSPAGTVLDPAGIGICTSGDRQESPAVAFDGTNFLVTWMDERGGTRDIYGCRVSPAGAVLDPKGIGICTSGFRQESPAVAFDGTNFFVAWMDWRTIFADIYGARLRPDGTVADSADIAISTEPFDQNCPAVAFDGANLLVVWQDWSGDGWDICGCRVSPAGTVFDEGLVVRQDGHTENPALVRGLVGQMFMVRQGWTGTVSGKTYDACRIWGKVNPSPQR